MATQPVMGHRPNVGTVLGPGPGPVSPSYSVWRRAIHLIDVRALAAATSERAHACCRPVRDSHDDCGGIGLRLREFLDSGDGVRVSPLVRGSRTSADARARNSDELLAPLPQHRSPAMAARWVGAGQP